MNKKRNFLLFGPLRIMAMLGCAVVLAGCGSTTRPLRTFEHGAGYALAATFSRDGTLLAASSEDGSVRVWEVASGRELARAQAPVPLPPRGYTLEGMAFSRDAVAVAFVASGGKALLWRWRAGETPRQVLALDVPVRHVAFSSDARALTVAGGGMEAISTTRPTTFPSLQSLHVRRIDLATGRLTAELRDPGCGALALALAADGERVAVTCMTADGHPLRRAAPEEMKNARAWLSIRDVHTGRELISIGGAGHVFPLFSDDGKYLAAGDKVWDTQTGALMQRLGNGAATFIGGGRSVLVLEHSHGSRYPWELMATTTFIRPVRVDLKNGRRDAGKRMVLEKSGRSVEIPVRPAFSPDGRLMVDYDLNLWRLAL